MLKQVSTLRLGGLKNDIVILIASALVLLFSGCSPLRFSSVKYSAARLDSVFADTSINRLLLQYYSPDPDNFKRPYVLTSYPVRDSNIIADPEPYILETDTEIKIETLKRKKVSGNLVVTRAQIESAKADLQRKTTDAFAYLLFTPVEDSITNYIYYDVSAGTSKKLQSTPVRINPCPPAVCFKAKVFQ